MKIVRCGISRTVILTRRHAIKFPTLRGGTTSDFRGRLAGIAHGVLANQSEYHWTTYEPWAGKIAPVQRSWLGGLIQIYPRCEPLADDDRGPLPKLDPCPGDIKPDNYGRLNGRVVRVDYAW